MASPIYLIGARGSGKTTTGQALAQALGYAFVDTDHYLQQITQRSVADIVAAEGWQGFRRRESESLIAVTAPDTVIATGGGMVLADGNRCFMQQQGTVIYLRAAAGTLAARLQVVPQADQRPTLTGRPVSEEIEQVLAEREALYHHAAHHVIDASQPLDNVVRQILDSLSPACTG
ncbi:shikimate kinase II [Erwinia sp. OLTSP20]|uniref:shikimate kinase AroL n=1 Tax=unclassified Erwinia TaxID=2622719 RepID=UPI000C19DFD8|nr:MULTISPECIES: shikimate kinase AroL [unclassified Erwinia]PIJ49024.1 shikimate kinase II [Erwinia sp. OAMSP11]PIJ75018.1 shikimate kinase II [Erwinia sp. OLSSP12]PIJ79709.1 shikimate kinase II [Erwinia sp. OLCASP19]PIJ80494.1 shikimate kinase II [Erwinia sp. OLMTSP26]PIJ82609.1 shikimate kinase II [Erwinia sp. OLMDSP33]